MDTDTLVRPPRQPHRLRARRRSRLGVIGAFLVVVACAELGARGLAARIDDPQGWNVPPIAEHVANLRALAAAGTDVDVVLVGSSVVGQGLDPTLLAERSSTSRVAYSLHGNGLAARSHEVVVEDIALRIASPDVVVVGLTPREVNDAGDGQSRQHEHLLSSPELRRLAGDETAAQRVERQVGGVSDFVRLRAVWRQPALLHRLLQLGPRTGPTVRSDGMEIHEDRPFSTNPGHLAQERAALEGFSVGGRELDALRRMIARLRDREIRTVIVNMPVEADVYVPMLPRGRADVERYEAAVERLVEETGAGYVDGTSLGWGRQWFSNENHLNARGAARLTSVVAEEVDAVVART